jgi:endonuclease/exonuclease/phosphatase family metal-dependent hydrolase
LVSIFSVSFGEPVNIMSFNIRNSKDSTPKIDGKHNWPARKNKIISLIKEESFDIFGIQEAFYDQVMFLDKELPGYGWVGVGRDDGQKIGEHSNIYYKKDRFSYIAGGTFWLSETPEKVASVGWDAELTRIATWVRLEEKKTGKRVLVFNTHFDHIGMLAQEESAKLLADKSKEFTDSEKEAVIIMGDLNFERTNKRSYNAFKDNYRDAKVITATTAKGENFTYNGFGKNPVEEIDYIFVNNKIKVNSYGQFKMIKDGIYLSDHGPVISEIKLLKQ